MDLFDLYRECFPEDSLPCATYITDKLFRGKKYVFSKGGEVISALYLVDKKLVYKGKKIVIPHVVALGTAKRYRRRGYAEKILIEGLRGEHSPVMTLYPFLHSFYEKYGFVTVSYDPQVDIEGISANDEMVEEGYRRYTDGLDYYIDRGREEHAFFHSVYAIDGTECKLSERGVITPDGFLPYEYSAEGEKGVMARIVDIESALALTDITTPFPIEVTDDVIESNNRIFSLKSGKMIPCKEGKIKVDIGELTKGLFGLSDVLRDVFPPLKGHLADRY